MCDYFKTEDLMLLIVIVHAYYASYKRHTHVSALINLQRSWFKNFLNKNFALKIYLKETQNFL